MSEKETPWYQNEDIWKDWMNTTLEKRTPTEVDKIESLIDIEEGAIEVLEKGKEEGHTHILSKVSEEPLELCNSCKGCCILWKLERVGIHCISKDRFEL